MCDHHFQIGKLIIDEAMRLIRSSFPSQKEITICKCTISAALQKLTNNNRQGKSFGMFRLVFIIDGQPEIVLVNADYVIKKHRLKHV